MMNGRDLFIIFFLTGILFPLFSDEGAVKKQLALLQFSTGKTELSPGIFLETEEGMKRVIAAQSGFEVTSVAAGLGMDEAAALLELLTRPKNPSEPPRDTITVGGTSIPLSEFEKMRNASVVVVPTVADFRVEEENTGQKPENRRFKVRLTTAFHFLKLEGETGRTTRIVETMGYDRDREQAINDAVKNILPLFTYELGHVTDLAAKTSILSFENGEAYIERGGKQGVLPGAEFTITSAETLPDGRTVQREKGLILITEVTDAVSLGTVRYTDGDLEPGNAVSEVQRFGLEFSPYVHAFLPYDLPENVSAYAGFRLTLSKWVFNLRPFISVESAMYPFSVFADWIQIRPFIGIELRAYFGRFEIAALPMVGIEEWFGLSSGAVTTFWGFGLRGLVELALLVSRDFKVFIDGGYDYWFDGRQGFLAGGGISIKL